MNRLYAPKGTRDIFWPEVALWQFLEAQIRSFFSRFFFRELRTPVFEHSELFLRSIGESTEVVQKEMYTFQDKAGRRLTLRPENTASVVRALIDGNLAHEIFPPKFFYIGPMFRYDKPQKGRFRQFHQFGVEVFADPGPLVDAEVIFAAYSFLKHLGITDTGLNLNSVGCPHCRAPYLMHLSEEALVCRRELCIDCQRKSEQNPLRIFDCKNEGCREKAASFTMLDAFLCAECRDHFLAVQDGLRIMQVPFQFEPRLVRGLDYYTRTAFEITSDRLGAQNALLGGGRYDNLVRDLGGPDICGIGFAAGMERIILHLNEHKAPREKAVVIAYNPPSLVKTAAGLAAGLWREGIPVFIDYQAQNFKIHLKRANRLGADFTLILGEEEVAADTVGIKNMTTQEQLTVSREEVLAWLKANL